MTTELMDLECMTCERMFKRRWFDVSLGYERVHYKSPLALDEVEISQAEGIGVFCSQSCLDFGRLGVLQKQGISMLPARPGIGPIETCAKCSCPVDMSDWHLTSTDGENVDQGSSVSVVGIEYVATVCKKCLPRERAARAMQNAAVEESKDRISAIAGSIT